MSGSTIRALQTRGRMGSRQEQVNRNMKKRVAAVLGLILLSGQSLLASEQCGWPNSVALDSVVRVTSDDGSHASGVVVADDQVLTAAHAIDENFKSYVRINDHLRSARVAMIDRAKDLAILTVRTGEIRPIPLGSENLNASATVWAVGFPRAESKTTSSGSFKVRAENDGALHTTAPIDSGQSGGGLISCERGRHVLAGMLRGFAAYVNGDHYVKIKNHSVSVASADIRNFLVGWENRSN